MVRTRKSTTMPKVTATAPIENHADPRQRLLRYLRRMPCAVGYTIAGVAYHTWLRKSQVRATIATLEQEGVVSRMPHCSAFYSPVRAECLPGKRCRRPACRLAREATRLVRLADKVAAS